MGLEEDINLASEANDHNYLFASKDSTAQGKVHCVFPKPTSCNKVMQINYFKNMLLS